MTDKSLVVRLLSTAKVRTCFIVYKTSLTIATHSSPYQYSYQDRTKNDICNVLNCYRGLKPRLEKCTLPTGVKRELLCLKGTIPVSYRNNVYNIPVNLWILNNHPESAPICWVNPTKDMTIKVSRHVDETGRIFLPYLSDWSSASSGKCFDKMVTVPIEDHPFFSFEFQLDLLGVIQVMIIVFGEQPPLYSRPKTTVPETATTSTGKPGK